MSVQTRLPAEVVLHCERCRMPMALEDAAEGDVYECPHCAHPTEVETQDTPQVYVAGRPRAPTHADPSDARQEDAHKDDPAVLLGLPRKDGPERDVLRVYPAMGRSNPLLFAGLWALLVVGMFGVGWMALRGRPLWLVAVPGLGTTMAGGWLLWWWLSTRSSEIRVTTKRLIDREGFFHRRVTEILYRDIKRLELRQTFWQRLCGVGELSISADTEDGPEVFMAQVPKPDHVRRVIDVYRTL
jgi:hypothetical protein